jgi:hypothetical protein
MAYAREHLERDFPGAMEIYLAGCGADSNPSPRGRLHHARQGSEPLRPPPGGALPRGHRAGKAHPGGARLSDRCGAHRLRPHLHRARRRGGGRLLAPPQARATSRACGCCARAATRPTARSSITASTARSSPRSRSWSQARSTSSSRGSGDGRAAESPGARRPLRLGGARGGSAALAPVGRLGAAPLGVLLPAADFGVVQSWVATPNAWALWHLREDSPRMH